MLTPLLLQGTNGKLKREITWLSVTPLILLTALKGGVGTDTQNYIEIIGKIAVDGELGYNFEPAFLWSAKVLTWFFNNHYLIINIFALVVLLISTYAILEIRFLDQRVLYAVFFSYIMIDICFNSLRFGLALSFFLLGLSKKGNIKKSFFCFLVAAAFHFSILYVIVWFYVVSLFNKSQGVVSGKILASIIAMMFLAFIYYQDNFFAKADIYFSGGFAAPSSASGLAPLVMCFLTSFLARGPNRKAALLLIGVSGLCFLLAKYSYMFLRVLQMNLVLVVIASSSIFSSTAKLKKSLYTPIFLIFLFVIGAGFKVRNFYDESTEGGVATPFIPYRMLGE